ncbi:hypothetical protein L218DRAFT_962313 [Marasmius fiardii PR-910]|nr:hypothetical protein L218DRAFT_962313 [Marasmius fiardii PR-910]
MQTRVYIPSKRSEVKGNAADAVKEVVLHSLKTHVKTPRLFAVDLIPDIVLSEVGTRPGQEQPMVQEVAVVFKMVINEKMLGLDERGHQGWISFLIDYCSSLALSALRVAFMNDPSIWVSQNLSILFHSQALLGDEMKIVSTSALVGESVEENQRPVMTARCEIWNGTRHCLVASGIHNMMSPKVFVKL